MRKITFYCDRCGKLITDKVYHEGYKLLAEDGFAIDEEYGAELCRECFEEIDDMIAFMIKNPKIHFENGKPKEEAPKKTHGGDRKSLKLDLGKIAALRNAGWSLEKIGQEMRCSPQTIANHMEEAQTFLKNKEALEQMLENDIQEESK